MPNYVFTYYGEPNFGSEQENAKHRARWQEWADGLGAALVNRGIPMGEAKTVTSRGVSQSNGNGAKRLTGFSIVKADSMDAALQMVKGCPHLEQGTVDVAEAMEM